MYRNKLRPTNVILKFFREEPGTARGANIEMGKSRAEAKLNIRRRAERMGEISNDRLS
jgi:hypothetical protein